MHANECRHLISIQRRSTTKDDYGQNVNTWATVSTTRASIRPKGGLEAVAGREMQAKLSHTVAVRYQATLVPPLEASTWRILFGTRILNIITSRNLEEKNRWIVFECDEGSRDGE